jgi:hypothetical protein
VCNTYVGPVGSVELFPGSVLYHPKFGKKLEPATTETVLKWQEQNPGRTLACEERVDQSTSDNPLGSNATQSAGAGQNAGSNRSSAPADKPHFEADTAWDSKGDPDFFSVWIDDVSYSAEATTISIGASCWSGHNCRIPDLAASCHAYIADQDGNTHGIRGDNLLPLPGFWARMFHTDAPEFKEIPDGEVVKHQLTFDPPPAGAFKSIKLYAPCLFAGPSFTITLSTQKEWDAQRSKERQQLAADQLEIQSELDATIRTSTGDGQEYWAEDMKLHQGYAEITIGTACHASTYCLLRPLDKGRRSPVCGAEYLTDKDGRQYRITDDQLDQAGVDDGEGNVAFPLQPNYHWQRILRSQAIPLRLAEDLTWSCLFATR